MYFIMTISSYVAVCLALLSLLVGSTMSVIVSGIAFFLFWGASSDLENKMKNDDDVEKLRRALNGDKE